MVRRIVALWLLVTGSAVAGPFKETLARRERDDIIAAIQAALPPVDQAAAKKCTDLMNEYNKDPDGKRDQLPVIARCYRAAGSLGASIIAWQQVERGNAKPADQATAMRELAATYEAAGYFDKAASYLEKLASAGASTSFRLEHVVVKDADDLRLRALCIWRQLGDEDGARRDTSYFNHLGRKTFDAEAACATLRPIAMPAKR
ncbi:MAG TPA: hypothetical protein VMJ10_08580 [Kofleriaceae bacterium]|nr:hypothetical protein [Kofleriaceae bacterium]